MHPSLSFTVRANGGAHLHTLLTPCDVFPASAQLAGRPITTARFQAIWDTGATRSVISQAVVDTCGLVATGMANVIGVNGPHESETYVVHIALPNGLLVHDVQVTKGDFGAGQQILIGMDIIGLGDFAVTNNGGGTVFSFRVPSRACYDFVQEHNDEAARAPRAARPPRPSGPAPVGKKKLRSNRGRNR